MKNTNNPAFTTHRSFIATTILLGALVLGAAPARAESSSMAVKSPTSLHLGVSTPMIIPYGYSSDIGVGVMPGVQLSLGHHFGINLTGGYIHYARHAAENEREIPLLVGVTYTFMEPSVRVRPYLTGKLGYTNSHRDGRTAHWLSAEVGGGALFRLGRGFAFDLGAGIVVTDLTGKADESIGLLLKLGLHYRI